MLTQEQIYKTLLSVTFPSVIQEGNHITSGINKEKQSWKKEESCTEKRVIQKHAHAQTPLLNSNCKKNPNTLNFPFES